MADHVPVTDADREAVEKWCRERGWLCPPEGALQAIARARAEEREACAKVAADYARTFSVEAAIRARGEVKP